MLGLDHFERMALKDILLRVVNQHPTGYEGQKLRVLSWKVTTNSSLSKSERFELRTLVEGIALGMKKLCQTSASTKMYAIARKLT